MIKRPTITLLLFVFYIFSVSGISAQSKIVISKQSEDSLRLKLEEFFGERQDNAPGAVLFISQNDKSIYKKKFGKSNLETNTEIVYETVFEAASVSKQFTAAAVLLLAEEGKLNIQDNVRKYVPQLPDYGSTITLQHLLTHTSGIKDWRNIVYLTPLSTATRLFTQEMAIDIICRQKSLNFKPGDQYRYSNSGYDLLGTIVERVSGQSFESFVQEKLLRPAGMINSHIRKKYTDIVINRATGYLTKDSQYVQGVVLDETTGAAGLYTTARDLEMWNTFVFSDKVSDHFKQVRLTQFILNDGTKIPYTNGGVEKHKYKDQTEIRHGGLISGYRAWLAYYPESKISVAYMSNDRSIMTTELSERINTVLFGKVDEVYGKNIQSPHNKDLEAIAGKYLNMQDFSVYLELNVKDGILFSNKKKAEFIGINEFLLGKKSFQSKENQLIETTNSGKFKYKRVAEVSVSPDQLTNYTGSFFSEDCNVTFHIVVKNDKLYATRAEFDQIQLTPIYQDGKTITFKGVSNGLGAFFHFTSNKDNSMGLSISLSRAAMIPFTNRIKL